MTFVRNMRSILWRMMWQLHLRFIARQDIADDTTTCLRLSWSSPICIECMLGESFNLSAFGLGDILWVIPFRAVSDHESDTPSNVLSLSLNPLSHRYCIRGVSVPAFFWTFAPETMYCWRLYDTCGIIVVRAGYVSVHFSNVTRVTDIATLSLMSLDWYPEGRYPIPASLLYRPFVYELDDFCSVKASCDKLVIRVTAGTLSEPIQL